MMHFRMIPGGSLESTNAYLFVIFIMMFPYIEFERIVTPLISSY